LSKVLDQSFVQSAQNGKSIFALHLLFFWLVV
jgi:hypothetical protein